MWIEPRTSMCLDAYKAVGNIIVLKCIFPPFEQVFLLIACAKINCKNAQFVLANLNVWVRVSSYAHIIRDFDL